MSLGQTLPRLGWLWCLLISLGQLHICTDRFVHEDGGLCLTCPDLDHPDHSVHSEQGSLADSHNDCHDCCELVACEDHPQLDSFVLQFASFEVFVPAIGLTLPKERRTEEFSLFLAHLCGHPPKGPPNPSEPRAPPIQVQTR